MNFGDTTPLQVITVFSGSADSLDERYIQGAWQCGACLALRGITLVYGAGKTGLMGAIADGALACKGEVIGVINDGLNTPELAHAGLTRLEVFPDLAQRKARMLSLAEGFICLPGGFGTFDELFEALTLAQLGGAPFMTSSPIRAFFIDLDDTVYPASSGVWPLAGERMVTYMHEVLGIPLEEAPKIRERLFHTYGTTLRGLQSEYGIDSEDYLAYVHDLDLRNLLQPDPELKEALARLEQPKWIFTNATREHAQNVLSVIQVVECFSGIIDIRDVQPYCKPDPAAYQIALKLAGSLAPEEVLMVDDRKENLDVAASLGFKTVLIADQPQPVTKLSTA